MLTWIGRCCREWTMAAGFPPGRCGLCQQVPSYVGPGPIVGAA